MVWFYFDKWLLKHQISQNSIIQNYHYTMYIINTCTCVCVWFYVYDMCSLWCKWKYSFLGHNSVYLHVLPVWWELFQYIMIYMYLTILCRWCTPASSMMYIMYLITSCTCTFIEFCTFLPLWWTCTCTCIPHRVNSCILIFLGKWFLNCVNE